MLWRILREEKAGLWSRLSVIMIWGRRPVWRLGLHECVYVVSWDFLGSGFGCGVIVRYIYLWR